ncbi:GNAT family protein [Hymenobacter sp. ASUV-10]|uniref:GNAT family protein n=1 Tax=Hymenobacter aranciens TaxID=3063996 RepID=A0ABT9BGB3_9BACT|nr:GNAT family protein [Hymenobacter sp. ASUV-10]MDO7877291.1 GNAT family protein [Hymenobacter sp. ASUV-10]
MSFTLFTSRLTLRPLRPADLPAFLAYRSDPNVARYQGFEPYTEAQAEAFIASQTNQPIPAPPGEWVQIGIARAEDDLLLGDCALHLDGHDPRLAEIGITLSAAFQGQGYAQEALRGLLRFCFETLELHRVIANMDVRNAAAVRLVEQLGLRREGHFRQNGWYKGEWCDEYQYALLGREWAARA